MEIGFTKVDAVDWLTDDRWIVFGYDSGFGQYLEQCYFKPGTQKNAEFEGMVSPAVVNGVPGIVAFIRIRDTIENRDSLRAALAEFHGKHLLTLAELDAGIEATRRKIKETILPILR